MSIARITKRFHSTSSDATVAAQLLKERTHKPLVRQQHFDANQLKLLTATLSRGNPSSITIKTPIPACYHLAYLTPCQFEEQLGADGTDRTFNPPAPFTRRMWAGGEVQWLFDEDRGLKVGDLVMERTSLTSIEPKMTRKGEEMLVVGVEKTYRASWSRGISVIDKRNWLFLPEITTPVPPLPKPPIVPFPTGAHHRDLLQTPVSLFRFSALTFNGHKIHYNREWCREVEGHRDLVVHGPLNLIHIMDFWKDVKFRDIPTQLPKKVTYRATNPIYVGEKYRIVMEDERNGLTEVRIVDSYGVTCMVATIESR